MARLLECGGQVETTGSATALALVRRGLVRRGKELAPVGFDLDAAAGKSIYRRTIRETWEIDFLTLSATQAGTSRAAGCLFPKESVRKRVLV
jgi:hypothetical protein